MGSIITTPEDYQNVLIAYLLDLLVHGNPTDNEVFDELLKKIKQMGLKSHVLNAFLEMDQQARVQYRMIRGTLMKESNTQSRISIIKSQDTKEE